MLLRKCFWVAIDISAKRKFETLRVMGVESINVNDLFYLHVLVSLLCVCGKHEQDLIQREDALRHQEEKYLEQISNLKKKEQALMKRRNDLRSDPYSAGEIDKLMKQKDENNEKAYQKDYFREE
jgi:hypothetical protein